MQGSGFAWRYSTLVFVMVLLVGARTLTAQTRNEPATGTDADRAAAAEEKAPSDTFVPKTVWERFYQVRYRGEVIGLARAELQSWHRDLTHVHEFERKLFSEPGVQGDAHFWDIERHSESQGQVIRYWGNGHFGAINWRFSVQGRGTATRLSRAWDGDVVDKKGHAAPQGYILNNRITEWLRDNREATDLTLGVEVPAWYVTPPGWVTLLIRPMGPDEVKTVEGPTLPAWRFRVDVAGASPRLHAFLWTDDQGRLLQKRIPFLALSYVPFGKAETAEEHGFLGWWAAQHRFQFDRNAFLLESLSSSQPSGPRQQKPSRERDEQEFAARMVLFDFGL